MTQSISVIEEVTSPEDSSKWQQSWELSFSCHTNHILFSVRQVTGLTVEVVINNGPPRPFKQLRASGRRRLGTVLGTPMSSGNYPHDSEKHGYKPFKWKSKRLQGKFINYSRKLKSCFPKAWYSPNC